MSHYEAQEIIAARVSASRMGFIGQTRTETRTDSPLRKFFRWWRGEVTDDSAIAEMERLAELEENEKADWQHRYDLWQNHGGPPIPPPEPEWSQACISTHPWWKCERCKRANVINRGKAAKARRSQQPVTGLRSGQELGLYLSVDERLPRDCNDAGLMG